jgi:hypothetical protein
MLDNSTIPEFQRIALKELHYGDDNTKKNIGIPYQTKINIFDSKCAGCGWCIMRVVEVLNRATGEMENVYEFDRYEDFVDFINEFSFKKTLIVQRGCKFNTNEIKDSKIREPFWNVVEIVQNTCEFWNNIPYSEEPSIDNEFFQWYYNDANVALKGFGAVLPGELFGLLEPLRPNINEWEISLDKNLKPNQAIVGSEMYTIFRNMVLKSK